MYIHRISLKAGFSWKERGNTLKFFKGQVLSRFGFTVLLLELQNILMLERSWSLTAGIKYGIYHFHDVFKKLCPTPYVVLSFFFCLYIYDTTNTINNIHVSVSYNIRCHSLYHIKSRNKGADLWQKCSFSQNSDQSVSTYNEVPPLERKQVQVIAVAISRVRLYLMSPFITNPFGIHSNCQAILRKQKKKLFDVPVDVICALQFHSTSIVIQH